MSLMFFKGVADGRSNIIVLGALVFAIVSCVEHKRAGHRISEMVICMPVIVTASILLCRVLHWYCRPERYESLISAVTNYHVGGYVAFGGILALMITIPILKALGVVKSVPAAYDSMAPAAALSLSVLKWKNAFDTACRGKVVVKLQWLQKLPFAAATATGEYRVAVFALQSLLFLVAGIILLLTLRNSRKKPGSTALYFLAIYGMIQIITDSMRYDASFMPFNGFVSFEQVFGAVLVLTAMLVYDRWAKQQGAAKGHRAVLWVIFWFCLAGLVGFEYLVQRHGNWYMFCYTVMTGFALMAIGAVKHMRDRAQGLEKPKMEVI